MSIHGWCFDYGSSGRCNMDDCDRFSSGDCSRPEDIFDISEVDSDEEEEEIFNMYPQLREIYLKKEIEMSKNKDALETQQLDRNTAAIKLRELVGSLTKVSRPADTPFFDGNEEEIYSDTVHVPVKVVCLENNGMRRVYVNAHEANMETLSVLVSKGLLDTFIGLKATVSEIDTHLGCENLGQMVTKALSD